jgi:hypothetical protein
MSKNNIFNDKKYKVDVKTKMEINHKIFKKMCNFSYNIHNKIYNTIDNDCNYDSLINNFSNLKILFDIDIYNPINVLTSKVYKSKMYHKTELKNKKITLMDDYNNYLQMNKMGNQLDPNEQLGIEQKTTQLFYNNIINNEYNNIILQLLCSLYKNEKKRFNQFPKKSEKNKKYHFPFKKKDKLYFILELNSSEQNIKPRKYLIKLILT